MKAGEYPWPAESMGVHESMVAESMDVHESMVMGDPESMGASAQRESVGVQRRGTAVGVRRRGTASNMRAARHALPTAPDLRHRHR